jgi:1-acyl-sn-glycerol-3-phosphate acyltransferase
MIARLPSALVSYVLMTAAYLITGAQARWQGCLPVSTQRLYFANHSSHFDFLLIWMLLPRALRSRTRPVAGADYWNASPMRRFLIHRVFRGVLVERANPDRAGDPLAPLEQALAEGDSLIFFPEGTRNLGEGIMEFKSGLYHLAARHPQLELVPTRLENLNRVLPKGELLPVPLVCTVTFGEPIRLEAQEDKRGFLGRAREQLFNLAAKPL